MTTPIEKVSFTVPTRDEVSDNNKSIFDHMQKAFGMVPNLYATFAYNDTALADYLALQNRKSTLTAKEREIINLVVSQVNDCKYCVPAHTAISKMHGFTDDEILQIRRAQISFNEKYAALATFVKETAVNKGRPSENALENFFEAGYNKASLVDVMMVIGDKIMSNYLHNITQIPVDWPAVPNI
ncbi:carboxymuconolactone decarboxylase family protein [Lacibacter sp. MH-610]|uniref:carboxymuconolactone decarboxylase family protein n=1 Tax=Lacibacter sp. MH-610 TaxID=3020883 RepID=UPI003891502E